MSSRKSGPENRDTISVLYADETAPPGEPWRSVLKEKGNISIETCKSAADAFSLLSKKKYDAIISGYGMPGCEGPEFILRLREKGNKTPVIIFAQKGQDETVIEMLNNGADYYLPKDGEPEKLYSRLSEIIVRLVAGRKKDSIIRSFFYTNNDLMTVKDEKFRYIIANDAALDFFGLAAGELTGKTDYELLDPEIAAKCHKVDEKALKTGKPVFTEENIGNRTFKCMKFPIEVSHGKTGTGAIIRDVTERILAEEALRRSEEQYKAIYDTSPIAIELYDPGGYLIHVNSSCLRLFGVEDIESLKGFSLFGDPNIGDEQKKMLIEGKTIWYESEFDFEKVRELNLYPTSRRGTIWLNVLLTPLKTGPDSISGYLVQVQDITDRKKAQDKIELHVKRLKSLLALYQTTGGSDRDTMSHALESSRSMTESRHGFIGILSSGESVMVIQQWSGDLMTDREFRDDPLNLPVESGGIWAECIRNHVAVIINDYSAYDQAKNGLPMEHVEISRLLAVPIIDLGKVTMILTVANKETPYQEDDADALTTLGNLMWEILKTRKAEHELRHEKELFWQTFESLQDAAFVLDADPVIIRAVNKAAVKLFGYSRNEMNEKKLDILHVNRKSLEKFNEHIHPYIKKRRKIPRFDFIMKKKDGTIFPSEHSISALYDPEGNPHGWVSIVRDITGRIELEKREKAALHQIEENLEQLATLNDQIRNPLAVILGLADLKCPDSLKEISDQVDEIDRLVRMLDEGWVRSEKIWEFLRTHYGFGKISLIPENYENASKNNSGNNPGASWNTK